jgi:hypothetical protein
MRKLAGVSLVIACLGCRTSIAPSAKNNCGLGPIAPIVTSTSGASCGPTRPHCPLSPPSNARTLVSVLACDSLSNSPPCELVHATVCPVLGVGGMTIHFDVSRFDDTPCISSVDVRLAPAADGGVTIDWTAQERSPVGGCHIRGPEFRGNALVPGPCCSRTLDVVLPNEGRTLRLTVQSDWDSQ